MKNENIKTEFDDELSLPEEEFVDRMIAEAAAAENADVDYGAMLARIKEKAREEGIVVFPSAAERKKNGRERVRRGVFRSALAGAVAAAAMFLVGYGMFTAVRSMLPGNKSSDISADVGKQDHEPSGDAVVTFAPVKATSEPEPVYDATDEPLAPVINSEPVMTAAVLPSDEVLYTPLPTETALRGSVMGYVLLESFESVPVEVGELLPNDLPGFMQSKGEDEPELTASSYGEADGCIYSYSCTLHREDGSGSLGTDDTESHIIGSDLSVGVAKYKVDLQSGEISYLWRISEDAYLEVSFIGFDRISAETMLLGLACFDMQEAA